MPLVNVTAALDDDEGIAFSIADDSGLWTIELPPQPASSGHTITISDGKSRIQLDDIAFGDVYLCSGQSNMQMSVQDAKNSTSEIEDSMHYPDLRLATVSMVRSSTPQQDVTSKASNYTWTRSGPGAFGSEKFSYFSATCYFFGRDLYTKLEGSVPIGLIVSCWGGQRVEAFSSPDALADETCGGTRYGNDSPDETMLMSTYPTFDSYQVDDGFNYDEIIGASIGPTELWNAMIHPLLPMRFTGAIWYQGESNAENATSYACRFPAMITDWRVKFGLSSLSFFYVELAAYKPGSTWAYVRAAQGAALKLDQVGFASAIDLADQSSPAGQIHPGRKQEVGRRLSLSVYSIQYQEDVLHDGPILASFHQSIEDGGGVTLNFVPLTAKGMHFHGSADCTSCCSESPYEVMDSNGNWARAEQSNVQQPNKVLLDTKVNKVFGIRYAWEPFPQCILYNGIGGPDEHLGLPATPFESCLFPSKQGPWTGKGCMAELTSTAKSNKYNAASMVADA
jgi:sialate O-acetylesterase